MTSMARPLRIQFPGAFYHLTCRGIERRNIFADDSDRQRFLSLLGRSVETYQVNLLAYVLMRNHFHLLIQTRKANCAEFMRHFNISYTGWFNWRHKRKGNLYQGRYHAFIVDADNYLLEVSRYLHLNPVRVPKLESLSWSERWRYAREYPWSSLLDYVQKRRSIGLIRQEMIISMIGGHGPYREFMVDGLKLGSGSPFKEIINQTILGDEQFVEDIKLIIKRGSAREQSAYRDLVIKYPKPEEVLSFLTKALGVQQETLSTRRGDGVRRGLVAEFLYHYCNLTQAQIGKILGGIDYMAVYQLRRRLRAKMEHNPDVKKLFYETGNRLKDNLL